NLRLRRDAEQAPRKRSPPEITSLFSFIYKDSRRVAALPFVRCLSSLSLALRLHSALHGVSHANLPAGRKGGPRRQHGAGNPRCPAIHPRPCDGSLPAGLRRGLCLWKSATTSSRDN